MPSQSRPSNAYRDETRPSRVLRYLVRHYHPSDSTSHQSSREEVIVTYSGDLDAAFDYAVHTALRYRGVIYAEYSPSEPYEFVRSYAKRREGDLDESPSEEGVAAGGAA